MRHGTLVRRVDQWLMPRRCIVCDGHCSQSDICRECAVTLPWNNSSCNRCALPMSTTLEDCGSCLTHVPRWQSARCAFVYDAVVARLLHQFKFSRRLSIGRVLSVLFAGWLASFPGPRPDLLLPVPLHWRRQMHRQFNQSSEIAQRLGADLQIPVAGRLCRRRRATRAQSSLPARERQRNLANAFALRGNPDGCHIAIVDDILTTGATANALSDVLLAAGASRVDVWTLARASLPSTRRVS